MTFLAFLFILDVTDKSLATGLAPVVPALVRYTANHSSLRVVREFLTARFTRGHSCQLPTRRHLPLAATAAAQALKSVQICAICVPLLP